MRGLWWRDRKSTHRVWAYLGQHAVRTHVLGCCLTWVGFEDASAAACLAVQCGNARAHFKQAVVAISRSCSVTIQLWGRKDWLIISRSQYLCVRSLSSYSVLITTAAKMQLWDYRKTGCKSAGLIKPGLVLCVGKQMKAVVVLCDLVISLFREVRIWRVKRLWGILLHRISTSHAPGTSHIYLEHLLN